MQPTHPKTHAQIRRLFGLAKGPAEQAGWDPKEFLEDLASQVSGGAVERLSLLSFGQANQMIRELGGDPIPHQTPGGGPSRTERHRRQKAGVVRIASPGQLRVLSDLAAGRGITDQGLKNLCNKMIKKPAPRTSAEASKIIEAIKAMNKRDEQYGPKRTSEVAA